MLRTYECFRTLSFILVIYCLFVIEAGLASDSNQVPNSPNGVDILQNILKSRLSIKKGHVEVESVTHDFGQDFNWKWSIWFDSDNLRTDFSHLGYDEVVCVGCYPKKTRLYYSNESFDDPDMKMALTFYDADDEPTILTYIPNPVWFGCIPMNLEDSKHFSPLVVFGDILQKQDGTVTIDVVSDTINETPCWKLSFAFRGQHLSNPAYNIWVECENLLALRRMELHFGLKSMDVIEVDGNFYDDSSIWFPSNINYSRFEGDKKTRSSRTNIIVKSLNKQLPRDTFSLNDIAILKPGTVVHWALDRDRPFPEGEMIWDGNKIVAVDELYPFHG